MENNLFRGVIGQTKPKKEFEFYLESYKHTRIIPNFLVSASKGGGKNTIINAVVGGLYQFDLDGKPIMVPSKEDPALMVMKRKPVITIDCPKIKNIKGFFGIIHKYVHDKDVTVILDESSELPRDVTMALLPILNPTPEHRSSFELDDYVYDFDFRRQSFFFATSEIHRMFHALVDRLERITLEEYTLQELAQIVQLGIPGVQCEDDVLLDVATVLRGNGRGAQKMAEKIAAYVRGGDTFFKEDWTKLKEILSIYPLGLNAMEIQILRHLASQPNGTSLTALSAKTGLSRDAIQKDSELYLQKNSLMSIETTGRMITAEGQDYLEKLQICSTKT